MNSNNCRFIFYAFNKKWKSISECCKLELYPDFDA